MSLRDLTKNTIILASPKIVSFFIKIFRAKLNAVYLGTLGVGVVNQIQNINNLIRGFGTLSLDVGAKKVIVSNINDGTFKNIPKIINLYIYLVLFFTLLMYLIGLLFYNPISTFFLGKAEQKYFIYIFIFYPLLTLRTIPETVLGAFQKFTLLAKSELILITVSFIFFIPLIYLYKIKGVIISLSLSIIIGFCVYTYFFFKELNQDQTYNFVIFKNIRVSKELIYEFISISGVFTILSFISVFVEIGIRGILANSVGLRQIGLYAPIIAWSGFFSSLFLPALFQYIFPKYGLCKTNEELIQLANNAFRLVTFLIIPFVLIILSNVKYLIPLFYSKDFLAASIYFPLHFLGIFFWTWGRILKQMFIPTGRIKVLSFFVIIEESFNLLVVLLFVNSIGLWSWALKFSLVPFIVFLLYLVYLRKEIKFLIKMKNIILMFYGVISLLIISYINNAFILAIIFSAILILFLSNSEKKFIILRIKKLITN